VGSINVFLEAFEKVAPERKSDFDKLRATTSAETYNDIYTSFKNEAIDYVLNEKMDNLLVVPATFDWRDIGSFTDLSDASETDDAGNAILGSMCETIDVTNSYIRNETDEPLAVIGLDNVVVVKTAHGVLVMRKDLAQKVKDIVTRLAEKKSTGT
jgi:mannose-1-phosphate guanylyltransferase